MEASGTKNHQTSEKRASQKTGKTRPRKTSPSLGFDAREGLYFLNSIFEPWASLGPTNGPQVSPESPRMAPQTPFLVVFLMALGITSYGIRHHLESLLQNCLFLALLFAALPDKPG